MREADILAAARRVLFVHAHPDDETLATGGLIARLTAGGTWVAVLTATRGEQGEVVPGVLPSGALDGAGDGAGQGEGGGEHEGAGDGTALTRHREGEVERACRTLGVGAGAFLGDPPARVAGRPPRTYADSGMRWLDATETVAGPSGEAGPNALTSADAGEVADDIAAYARSVAADLIVSYDAHGGYGHPDHVFLHAPSRAAAATLGVPFLEVASTPGGRGLTIATPDLLGVVAEALRHHASQVVVEGDEVVHVGGQRQPIALSFTLRVPHDPAGT